jgi:Glycosyl transferases group 1
VSTSESELEQVGPKQLQFAGHFELIDAAGGPWLAFPAGRHRRHADADTTISLCLAVSQAVADLDAQIADLQALAPPDAEILLVESGSTDWTLTWCLRAAAADERVIVYRAPVACPPDVMMAGALGLAAAPLALLAPPHGRLRADVVTVLQATLGAAPALVAAVAASARPGAPDSPPWCGVGYVHGATAAARAIGAPVSALAGRPMLIRTAAARAAGGTSLRELLIAGCAAADVMGTSETLSFQLPSDETGPATRQGLDEAVRAADLATALVPAPAVVTAAARAVADRLAGLTEITPAALQTASLALQRLAVTAAAARPGRLDLDRYRPGVTPMPIAPRGLRFLCSFDWDGRPPGGLPEAIGAFVSSFAAAEPVSLLLWPALSDAADAGAFEAWLVELITGPLERSIDEIPDIVVQTAHLRVQDRPALYAAIDCVIALPTTGGELTALEAMACGVPVVAAPDGALEALVTEASGFPVGPDGIAPALRAARGAGDVAARGAMARARLVGRGHDPLR